MLTRHAKKKKVAGGNTFKKYFFISGKTYWIRYYGKLFSVAVKEQKHVVTSEDSQNDRVQGQNPLF